MTADLPLLLLDVDGVLNPFAAAVCPADYQEYGFFPGEEPVRLNRVHGRWLNGLAEHFEIVWATGWEEEANEFLAPFLGLERLPVVFFPPKPFEPCEKVPAVAAFVGERAAAWVDDALTPQARAWADGRAAATLLVDTDPCVGLTWSAVEQLSRWSMDLRRPKAE
ncbi:HAD domain-containing protein [Kitasatospora sp. MY 5-36]|uniref:HAD domain-containing protein n=1 Tax=Kitasatospora sp. MY 5-36 TaxID=1678027 RepID=UPI0006712A34|nr:HAD domain-containing protein [Kitasatospora sp. MY 5-36]